MKKEEKVDLNQQLDAELAKYGFGDMLALAENITDMSVSCTSTGFPQLDIILHRILKGLPHGRDIEIFSKEPEVGKDQSLNSKLLTPSGWVRMGDIKLGDELVSEDGKPSFVIGVYPQGKRPVFKVTFSDGRSTEAGGEHLWELRPSKKWEGKRAKKVVTTYGLIEWLRSHPKSLFANYQFPLLQGNYGDRRVPISPWLLGVLLGDGGLTKSIKFTTADLSILTRLKEEVKLYECEVHKRSRYDYGIVGTNGNNKLLDSLKILGLYGKKSPQKFIPEDYLWASKKDRLELLRGLIDTDGTVNKKGSIQFNTTSHKMATQVVDLVRSIGGLATISNKQTSYTYKGEKKQGLPSYKVSIRHSEREQLVWLERKKNRIHRMETPRLTIKSVEYLGEMETQCIKVSHPSHLYITDDYIVTHNTSLGLQILQYWQSLGKRTLIIDVERTITVEFLNQLGIITNTNDPNRPAVRISRPADGLSAEQVLDLVKDASNVFDLIVVDSIGAMDIKANLEKDADENNKIGAMALLLSNFLKRNVAKRATVVWINQTRQIVGGYNPTGNIRYATMGGRALPFFGSIRLDLSIIEKMKDANEDVYAMKVKVYTFKNKVSPQFKSAILTYVMGEGFSIEFDYLDMALKLGIIQKKTGWYQYGDVRIQGEMNFYQRLKTNKDLLEAVKNSIAEELTNSGAAAIPES